MRLSLRDVLKREGVTQTSFAREMGVSKTYVNQMCNVENYYVEGRTLYGEPTFCRRKNHKTRNIVIDDINRYIKK